MSGSGVAAELATFFTDVPERLARAHLVISRSGASSIAEIAMVGRPAILVPYLHAADDHQSANARALERAGAAWVMPQPTLHGRHARGQAGGADRRARDARRRRVGRSRTGTPRCGTQSRRARRRRDERAQRPSAAAGDRGVRRLPLDIGMMHFVGIGGIGMSGIAEILHNLGYQVQGSDLADGANVQRLRRLGIRCRARPCAPRIWARPRSSSSPRR